MLKNWETISKSYKQKAKRISFKNQKLRKKNKVSFEQNLHYNETQAKASFWFLKVHCRKNEQNVAFKCCQVFWAAKQLKKHTFKAFEFCLQGPDNKKREKKRCRKNFKETVCLFARKSKSIFFALKNY